MDYYEKLAKIIEKEKPDKKRLSAIKNELCRQYKLKKVPSDIQVYLNLNESLNKIKKYLTLKPVRTISGVAPIAIMTHPLSCPPQAKCSFCPGGPGSPFGDVPKSYTGNEPASRRAIRNKYDSYLQVFNRLEHYAVMQHCPEKVELIIMSGTFPALPDNYRANFIKYAYKAMNDFSEMFFPENKFNFKEFKNFFELPAFDINDKLRTERIHEKLLKLKGTCSLEKEKLRNEDAKIKCVALVQETRPDCSTEKYINNMLNEGATRVELGVQNLNDEILLDVERGNTVSDIINAAGLLKDSFLKLTFHMMPGLPKSTYDSDVEMFKELFSNQDFMPDSLKIYPCMVLKGTKLYERWLKKEFFPITTEEAVRRIAEIKKYIPKWARIYRIQRDIPTYVTEAGVDKTNLRQEVEKELKIKGIRCRCIRCREPKNKEVNWNYVKLLRQDYQSSKGKEVFLSFEDIKNDIMLGFCRLRIPFKPFRPEITENSAGIRELHIYGTALPLGEHIDTEIQHKGYGKKLVEEAERIAKEEFDCKKMLIISGVGVRNYYIKNFNYKKDNVYVSKEL